MQTEARRSAIPNANNPRLVKRVVHWLARGVRTSRGLQEVLGVELRTVQYYLQAVAWLGLSDGGTDHLLTPLGLELAFSPQPHLAYDRAVWTQPFVAHLLSGGGGQLPPVEEVVLAIARAEPQLAASTARRRASAVRSLIAPALDHPPRLSGGQQLALPLTTTTAELAPRLHVDPKAEVDPDVYRYLYGALLDFGELTLGQLRHLLDQSGVREVPIGAYIDLAIQRRDARRSDERLIITAGGVARRHVASSTASIVLSHARYRQWLDDLAQATNGDRRAEIRCAEVARRFLPWDRRILGSPANPETLHRVLRGILLDRSLDSFPMSGDAGPDPTECSEPFLDCWRRKGIIIALPPSMALLQGGLSAVNRALKSSREGTTGVSQPTLADRPTLVHGGLLHPNEPRPRAVPDVVSLRQRAIMNCPYAAMVTAVLWLHRQTPGSPVLQRQARGWVISWNGRPLGALIPLLDRFAESRGWIPSRRETASNLAGPLLTGLEAIGICHVLSDIAVLCEPFFHRLRSAPEQMEVLEALRPLADALDTWLSNLPVIDEARS
ncbi:MAG: hypothetical protein ACI9MC_000943 [Kiritimatiellia bacterium]|jgi:hypothetical protein